jgi:hypothetical protein
MRHKNEQNTWLFRPKTDKIGDLLLVNPRIYQCHQGKIIKVSPVEQKGKTRQ